jgi:nucleoside-diphosphate-sugar epimerase
MALDPPETPAPAVGDVRDLESLRAAARGCQAVVHLAAFVRNWSRRRRDFHDVNVRGFANAARAALDAGAERFIHTSSFLVLGPAPPERPRTEGDPPELPSGATDYARTKALAEREREWIAGQGLTVITLHPGVLYGPGALTPGNLVGKLLLGWLGGRRKAFLAGDGSRVWNYVFIEDVVRAHLSVLEIEPPHRRYIVAGANLSQRDFFGMAAAVAAAVPAPRGVPFPLLEIAARLEMGRALLTGAEPQITPAIVRTFREHWCLDGSLARAELGIEPTPPAEAMALTVRWAERFLAGRGS